MRCLLRQPLSEPFFLLFLADVFRFSRVFHGLILLFIGVSSQHDRLRVQRLHRENIVDVIIVSGTRYQ